MSMNIRTWIENYYKFEQRRFYNKDGFDENLLDLIEKWKSPYRTPSGSCFRCKDSEQLNKYIKKAIAQRKKFFTSLEKSGKFDEFQKDVFDFLSRHKLGFEWCATIIDLIVSGWLCPPQDNLYLNKQRDHSSMERVSIILNPDTSLKDIRNVWKKVKILQKELWPNFKKEYFTKKSLKTLFIAKQDIIKRMENAENQYNDLDLVAQIWEEGEDIKTETDRRRKNNLRQIRHRSRKKA